MQKILVTKSWEGNCDWLWLMKLMAKYFTEWSFMNVDYISIIADSQSMAKNELPSNRK